MNKILYKLVICVLLLLGCVVGAHWCAIHIDKPHFAIMLIAGMIIGVLIMIIGYIYELIN